MEGTKPDPLVEVSDAEDDEEANESTQIDKTKEQLEEEAIEAWKLFYYPKWAPLFIYVLFFCCLINLILTLDQWHGTRMWRKPFDLYPATFRPGGWQEDTLRFASGILGMVAGAFSFVLAPSKDKFVFMFCIMFAASVMALVQFGKDLYHLNRAVDLPECNQINDMMVHKYICVFDAYRATVIFDIICGVFGCCMAFFILYQALSGTVSRKMIFNEKTGHWEKIVLMPDEPYAAGLPKRFSKQRPVFVLFVFITTLCFGTLLALTITQTTNDLFQGPDQAEPWYNAGRNTPVDLYLIQGDEAIRIGSWPLLNFELRLAVNAAALVLLSFLIQWRRDGRTAQIWVLSFLFCASIVYIACFAYDYAEYKDVEDAGCQYAEANNQRCVYHRYLAVIIFDGFCGIPLLLFSVYNLLRFLQQAMNPINAIETRKYGWWCFGETAEKKRQKAFAKSLIGTETDE